MKIYKKVLKEVSGDFINNKIEEICSQEKLSGEEVTYFFVIFLQSMFP